MKLLIITQKVDKNDPILGFFHRWIEEFSKHCEKLSVICLQKGESHLPNNIKILSLGKEDGHSLLKYLWRFYKYIWRERNNYNTVFVHMNQEYVILGWGIWKLFGKKVHFWRNHRQGNSFTRLAVIMSNQVFCTSPQSFTAQFKKTKLMPVGIDPDLFKPDLTVNKRRRSILALGRISPVKRLEILIAVLLKFQKKNIDLTVTIVGSPISPLDKVYEQKLHKLADPLVRTGRLDFRPAVPHVQTPILYNQHEIYVNMTSPGSMDKTIFEAMACGVNTVVAYSESELIKKLGAYFLIDSKISQQIDENLSQTVRQNQALSLLIRQLSRCF